MGKLFFNPDLNAHNVIEIKFNYDSIKNLIEEVKKDDLYTHNSLLEMKSDVKWISQNSFRSYRKFYDYIYK